MGHDRPILHNNVRSRNAQYYFKYVTNHGVIQFSDGDKIQTSQRLKSNVLHPFYLESYELPQTFQP